MIKSFFAAMLEAATNFFKTGKFIAPKSLKESRLRTCDGCSFKYKGSCVVCGCNLELKSKLLTSKCPLNKWS